MKIANLEVIQIGRPKELGDGGKGEFLVSPLNVFSDRGRASDEFFVGLRGGPVYAVLVRITTDDGIYGLGSVGVGSGAAAYILEHHLQPILVGQDPFDVDLL